MNYKRFLVVLLIFESIVGNIQVVESITNKNVISLVNSIDNFCNNDSNLIKINPMK